ncbi:hypothetical protein LINGRAHAP2_LOCUS12765 [Linum grandiflorum]
MVGRRRWRGKVLACITISLVLLVTTLMVDHQRAVRLLKLDHDEQQKVEEEDLKQLKHSVQGSKSRRAHHAGTPPTYRPPPHTPPTTRIPLSPPPLPPPNDEKHEEDLKQLKVSARGSKSWRAHIGGPPRKRPPPTPPTTRIPLPPPPAPPPNE